MVGRVVWSVVYDEIAHDRPVGTVWERSPRFLRQLRRQEGRDLRFLRCWGRISGSRRRDDGVDIISTQTKCGSLKRYKKRDKEVIEVQDEHCR